jgi:hypothetical protein
MNNSFTFLAVVWIVAIPFLSLPSPIAYLPLKGESPGPHGEWSELLGKHVGADGNVDYRGFMEDKASLDNYLRLLADNPPGNQAAGEAKLAYYINLYNAATVMLILENYPVRSIKDIKKPWDSAWIKLGEQTLSLGDIEHKILREMGDPRIHFAINCASFSCPKLRNSAYTAHGLEAQLEEATRDFIQDTTRNKIAEDSLELSKIFQWYKKDFTTEGSLVSYINNYTKVSINRQAKVSYITYNWSLNEGR